MAKKFSLVTWNIEHFKLKTTLKAKVVAHLKSMNPDVFAILEVVGKDVWRFMFKEFPDHNFFITEGPQTQQILVGVQHQYRCFLTQRDEFKSGKTHLRPGQFLTIKYGDEHYTMLFLHLKSISDPVGFGIRDNMIDHLFNLKKELDTLAGGTGKAKFIAMGDFNTMGMEYPYVPDISTETELKRLKNRAKYRKMSLLPKDHVVTWTNGNGKYSNLDHVLASDHITFKEWNGSKVKVLGWNKFPEGSAEFTEFVNNISDHCALYCEIH
jgi:exonuclease III